LDTAPSPLGRFACVINWLTTTNGRDGRQMATLTIVRRIGSGAMAWDGTPWKKVSKYIYKVL